MRNYLMPVVLIASILLGGATGCFAGEFTVYLKPIGEIFLNLIFTTVVPLIFFSISSAIARTSSITKLGGILCSMALVFLFTGIVAAVFALVVVKIFPPALGVFMQFSMPTQMPDVSVLNQITGIFTASHFYVLFSHEHILALIVFSILVGLATLKSGTKGEIFIAFLQAGEQVFMKVFLLIMYMAPLGFFAYFATLVNELGPKLMESYLRVAVLYYVTALIYFFGIFTVYCYCSGRKKGVGVFWNNIFLPTITSIATCSSAASIPANLLATKNMGVPPAVYETAIPLGSIIHKDGSVLGGIFKIAFLFGIFHLPFSGFWVLLTAVGVAVLVGSVMGAIPSGGMLGELLILSVYGFPPSVLIVVAAISIIIDPIATMINVTGNSVSSMMIARLIEGRNWLQGAKEHA